MIKILLVEDDKYLGESLKEYLEKNGFLCDWVYDDREVFSYLASYGYDIVLLDLILKFSKGEDILKRIRKSFDIPVIVLTAKVRIEDKETCFNLGADDYITKPFDPRELILRINSVLRRSVNNSVEIGDVSVDLNKKVVVKNGNRIDLTAKEWGIVEILVKNRGRAVSMVEILNHVWWDGDGSEESVRTYIRRIRSVLGKEFIKNIKGRGYLIP